MTHTAPPHEQALVCGLRDGDNLAFQEAVRSFTPGMLAVARFYLDEAAAADGV